MMEVFIGCPAQIEARNLESLTLELLRTRALAYYATHVKKNKINYGPMRTLSIYTPLEYIIP